MDGTMFGKKCVCKGGSTQVSVPLEIFNNEEVENLEEIIMTLSRGPHVLTDGTKQ